MTMTCMCVPCHELPSPKLVLLLCTRAPTCSFSLICSTPTFLMLHTPGVCKALFETHLLPRVLAGSSAGSVVCAIIATRTDIELRDLFRKIHLFDMDFFSNSSGVELVHHLIKKGSLQDITYMIKRLR